MNVARDAEAAVEDRMRSYGHPADNHACTAALWSAWLERRHGVRLELTAADVCWLNVLQKLSREAHSREPDNIVDVIGFAINAEMVGEPREPRAVVSRCPHPKGTECPLMGSYGCTACGEMRREVA